MRPRRFGEKENHRQWWKVAELEAPAMERERERENVLL